MKIWRGVLAVLVVLLFMPVMAATAQQSGATKEAPAVGDTAAKSGHGHHGEGRGMGHMCKEMMAKHDQFKSDMQAFDKRLDDKVAEMNAAKGEQKTAAMAAVISEMVAQRKEIRDKFASMHHGKMCAMMGHEMSKCCAMMEEHKRGEHKGASADMEKKGEAG